MKLPKDYLAGTRVVDNSGNPWRSSASTQIGKEVIYAKQTPEIMEMIRQARERMPDRIREGDNSVKEMAQAYKEMNSVATRRYKMKDQEHFTSEKERITNIMGWKDFCQRVSSIIGRRVIVNIPDPGPRGQFRKTRGLFCAMRGQDRRKFDVNTPIGWKYCAWIQVPFMSEWSVRHVDKHGLATSVKYQGWRSALLSLVMNGAITEEEAHREFGEPTISKQSWLYRSKLQGVRSSSQLQHPK